MENLVRLTGIVEPEDGMFPAHCLELGTVTCGDTVEEAIEVHIDALADIGTLQQEFQERRIQVLQRSTDRNPSLSLLCVRYSTVLLRWRQSRRLGLGELVTGSPSIPD